MEEEDDTERHKNPKSEMKVSEGVRRHRDGCG